MFFKFENIRLNIHRSGPLQSFNIFNKEDVLRLYTTCSCTNSIKINSTSTANAYQKETKLISVSFTFHNGALVNRLVSYIDAWGNSINDHTLLAVEFEFLTCELENVFIGQDLGRVNYVSNTTPFLKSMNFNVKGEFKITTDLENSPIYSTVFRNSVLVGSNPAERVDTHKMEMVLNDTRERRQSFERNNLDEMFKGDDEIPDFDAPDSKIPF